MTSVLLLSLDEIDEGALRSLGDNQIPESLMLEFKRELNLQTPKEKKEAAKDVSAMANTAGGRIIYGIEEVDLPNGSKVAGPLQPLMDGATERRLVDILVSTIHPRPRFRTRAIPVAAGGFVLVVEVYDSFGRDLHMVTGYDESRFFKRHDQVVLRMTEPEIREAYGRIAASRIALEASLEREVEEALAARKDARESIIVVPWYGSPRLLDPRELTSFRIWLKTGPLASAPLAARLEPYLSVCTSGFRSDPQGYMTIDYLEVHKTGLIHLSSMTFNDDRQGFFSALDLLERLSIFLLIAKRLFDQAGYWGPVRVVHTLRIPPQFDLITHRQYGVPGNLRVGHLAPGDHKQLVYDVVLRDATSFAPIIQEILDQVFHIAGKPECPWFEPSGTIDQSLLSMLTSGGAPVATQILGV